MDVGLLNDASVFIPYILEMVVAAEPLPANVLIALGPDVLGVIHMTL
jgi:hypothetical protein